MKKLRWLVSAGIAIAVSLGAWRHQVLRQSELEQTRLFDQIESAREAANKYPAPESDPPSGDALSPGERSELLKLRGRYGVLTWELARETNETARILSRLDAPQMIEEQPDEPAVSRAEARVRMDEGRQWMVALLLDARENGGLLPGSIDNVSRPSGFPEGGDRFELVLPRGDLNAIKAPARTIVLREKEPWKGSNGQWNRIYAFADGHVEIAVSPTGDFTEWEARLAGRETKGVGPHY